MAAGIADLLVSGGPLEAAARQQLPVPSLAPPQMQAILPQAAAAQPGFENTPAGQQIIGAESGNRNIPNFRFDPTHTAGGYFQITDTNWRHYAPLVGIDISKFPNAMSAPENLQGQVAGKMYAETGIMPWAGNPKLAPPTAGSTPSFNEFRQMTQEAYKHASTNASDALNEALKAPAGSQERERLIQESLENSQQMQKAFLDLIQHPPTEKPVDMIGNFGSAAAVIGLLGGLFAKRPMTASLNAAGAAMQALNTNNHEQFKTAYDTWARQSEMTSKLIAMQSEEIRNVLEDERLSETERMDRLNAIFHAYGMQAQADAARIGDWATVYQMISSLNTAADRHDLMRAQITEALATAQQRTAMARGIGQLDENTLSTMADQYIAGDKSVFQGLGYGNMGAQNRAALRTAISQKMMARAITDFEAQNGHAPNEEEREKLSEDIGRQLALGIAEFGGLQQAERTGYGRVAQLTIGAEEAKQFTPQAKELSAKVDRTAYPTLNKLILAAQEGTGDTNVVRFMEANVALIDAYAQVIGRGNSQLTDAARQQATNLLNIGWTQGQYDAAVDQINVEINAALQAPSEMLQTFRQGFAKQGEGGRSSLPHLGTAQTGGIPPGAKQIGTYQGQPVWQMPDGSRMYGTP